MSYDVKFSKKIQDLKIQVLNNKSQNHSEQIYVYFF